MNVCHKRYPSRCILREEDIFRNMLSYSIDK
jgi:hypothetical protein